MSHYRVRVKFANVEIEVDSSEQAYADAKLKEMISKFGAPKGGGGPEVARRAEEPETSPNPNGERAIVASAFTTMPGMIPLR